VVLLAPVQADQRMVYQYRDDFSGEAAMQDAIIHSAFWVKGAFPPDQPHLTYLNIGPDQKGILLRDWQGQPARLGYAVPVEPDLSFGRRPLKVVLRLDVQLLTSTDPGRPGMGYLLYMTSADAKTWSIPKALANGRSDLEIGSLAENRYLVFVGTNAVLDDLTIELYMPPPDLRVPADAQTIQEAIDKAADGQIIMVSDGVYTGPGNRDIRFKGKSVFLISEGGPDRCIIDCQAKGRGFILDSRETSETVIDGFTIRNGLGAKGGGIYCYNSSPVIADCRIQACWALGSNEQGLGGGIYIEAGSPQILGCQILQDWADSLTASMGGSGGGIYLRGDSGATIERCVLASNVAIAGLQADNRGGAICIENSGGGPGRAVNIRNCLLYANSAGDGGGAIAVVHSYAVVVNCTITANGADTAGGGLYVASGSQAQAVQVRNSILWANRPNQIGFGDPGMQTAVVSYSDVQGGWPGDGNIDADPLFARSFTDADGDAHLLSFIGRWDQASRSWVHDRSTSPCIDGGDPRDPVGPEPMPNGQRIDMGAYGGTNAASRGGGQVIFHVAKTGNDNNPGLSTSMPLATIQKAIELSRDGDVVMVWPGLYKEEVDFMGKAVLVQSAADAAVVTAASGAYAFSFYHQEGRSSILRNLVIKGCPEGGVFCHGSRPTLTNLTIVDCGTGIAAFEGAEPLITNCILWFNARADLLNCQATYSCIQRPDQAEGEGNITRDPMFADIAADDLHLRSRYGRFWPRHGVWVVDEQTSPCIDAGDPRIYPLEEPPYNGNRIDMGAHGGTGYASLSPPALFADLNQDGIVDLRDLALLADHWLESSD